MKTSMKQFRVLVVEAEGIVAADIQGRLISLGYTLTGMHGGRVWAAGQPGAGATFGFSLPCVEVPA